MEQNNVGSKDEQDEESEKERMQLVRGQVATILENYYEDTLVAPSGSAMAELVDKTSLKASQITSWYYRRKRKGSPHCAESSSSDSDKASSDSSKREGHAGPSKRAKFPANTVIKVEVLFNQLNGVLPSQKELDAFSAELNLSGSQVYAWWYRHKARLEKNGKEQQETQSRLNGKDLDPSKHSPSPSTGMDYAAWSALGFRLNNNNISNISIDTNGQSGESSAHAQAQQLAAALLHRVDKHTFPMHYTNAHAPAHPSQMTGGVSNPSPLDADALRRMLHSAAGPLSLFNYSALDSARSAVTALDPNSRQMALKVTASVQQQQGHIVIGPGFDNNSLTSVFLRTLQPNTARVHPGAGIPASSPVMGVNTGATAESAVGAFMINANPATKHMVTAALAQANRPTANPMGTPFGFAKAAPANAPVGNTPALPNNNNRPPGIVKPVCSGAHPLLSAFMSTTPNGSSSPMVGVVSQQWLANMLATNLTNLANLPAAPGSDQVSHQRPPSHLPPQYPPSRAAMLAASHQPAVGHHQPPVLTDNAAAMAQTILALQFALQSAQAARDEELRRPAGGQSAFNGNFNDGGCYSWSPSGSSAPFLPNSR